MLDNEITNQLRGSVFTFFKELTKKYMHTQQMLTGRQRNLHLIAVIVIVVVK